MRKNHYKSKLTITALILMLAIYPIFFLFPTVSAHEPAWTIPTHSYIDLSPNPIGVNQEMFVVMWVHPNPPTAVGIGGDRWRDMTLTVTAPDGGVENFGPWYSDSTGTKYILYTPNQIGEYEFTFDYPGQVLSWYGPTGLPPGNPDYLYGRGQDVFVNDTYTASSATAFLTVQADPVEKLPQYPLPTEYWTRPIEGQNTEWASIASHWLGGSYIVGNYQADGIAPNSPHILWTKPWEFGGVVGGGFDINGVGFYSGGSYEGRRSPMIMNGRLYYEMPLDHSRSGGGFVCVDLKTGEELWSRDDITPSFAQLYDYESMNQHGVTGGMLWATSGTTWIGIDGFTGKNAYNFTGVPRGSTVYEHSYGEIEVYVLDYANRRLALWSSRATNSSYLVRNPGTASEGYQYRPYGREIDLSGSEQYTWNVSIPDLPGDSNPAILRVIPGDLIFGTSTAWPNFRQIGTPDPYTLWAINLDESRGEIGELLWLKDYHAPEGYLTVRVSGTHVDPETRVFMMGDDEEFQWRGYSLDTGNLVWGPVGDDDFQAYQYFGSVMFRQQTGYVAYGKIFTQGYGGEVHCYDTATGTLLWEYNDTISGLENNWGDYPIFIGTIADGKVYTYNHEHSPNYPLYKGNSIRCLDASSGNEIWKLMGWAERTIVADGCLVFYNYYDNQLYVVGKGPSQTTLSVPQTATAKGSSVMITGSVIDTSAGTTQNEQDARFPNGVPAMSDQNMAEWMEYVYMQKPMPGNAKGVTVKLTAINANGETIDIGTTTTDLNGKFGISWSPTDEGEYQITASFEGSESYWQSYDTGYLVVDPAPAAPGETDLTGLEESVNNVEDNVSNQMIYILAILIIVIIALLIAIYSLLKK
jgi:outer membrane protein assembly factor BamB